MSWLMKRRPAEHAALADPDSGAKRLSRLTDDFLESYARWRETCVDVRLAYQRWANSTLPQRGLAFAAYRAALDREELAARLSSISAERLRASGS
jgi:hypothetical protein